MILIAGLMFVVVVLDFAFGNVGIVTVGAK